MQASIKASSVEEDKLTERKGALHKGGQTCGDLLYAGTFQPNSAIFTQVVNTLVVSWSCLFSKYELLHLNREYYHTRHRWCADWPVLGLFWKQQPCEHMAMAFSILLWPFLVLNQKKVPSFLPSQHFNMGRLKAKLQFKSIVKFKTIKIHCQI